MGKRWLKTLRVIISLIVFVIITAMFLDFTGRAAGSLLHAFLSSQFVPSLLNYLTTLAPVALGFAGIILLTMLFGRVYCSFLCPLGTLQDIFIFLSARLGPRKRIYRYKKPLNWLRYGTAFLVIFSFLSGSMVLLNLFDPYSAFGKIFHNLARPPIIAGNNLAAKLLSYADIYFLFPVKWVRVNGLALFIAMAWSAMLVVITARRGRWYCNTLCPVGTLLGIFARLSLFRIRIEKTLCNSCGKCSAVCKAECIDPKTQSVDFSRCVGCMNCLSPCPDNGVRFTTTWGKKPVRLEQVEITKRKFIRDAGIIAAVSLSMPKRIFSQGQEKREIIPATVPVVRNHPVTPPGAISQGRFNTLCTACHLCVTACPTQVLQPTYFLYGLKGILQPRMDYLTSFCNFDCTLCGEVCPTGAILPLMPEEKKLVQIGKSYFIKENCVVYTRNTDCGACSEHCPTKAVRMVPYQGKLTIPEVDNTICVGCGACEYACPTDPKSIYVDGNLVHRVAEKPVDIPVEQVKDFTEEFPF